MNYRHSLGAGPSKKALEAELARDITQRLHAEVPVPPPGMGRPWVITVSAGRKVLGVRNPQWSVRNSPYSFVVHQRFIAAPPAVRQYVVDYFAAAMRRNVNAMNAASRRAAEWINGAPEALAVSARKRSWATKRPDGLDLNDLYERMVKTHIWGTRFEKGADWDVVRLTWGRRQNTGRRGRGGRIVLGQYHAVDKSIMLHGNMQDARIPGYVVAAVMWHEMMHHWQAQTGRTLNHDAEFLQDEQLGSMVASADAWLKRNLDVVMQPDREPTRIPSRFDPWEPPPDWDGKHR